MFLLNLLFDPADLSGQFVPRQAGAAPLNQSKVWLQLVGPDPADPTDFNPEDPTVSWTVVGRDDAILISRGHAAPPFVAVRVAPLSAIDPASLLQAAVTFGRKPGPFTTDGTATAPVAAVFTFPDATVPTGQIGWYFPLNPLVAAPANPGMLHRYEFTVGAILNDGDSTYGHDPEMDVSL
jgi:hypothetical protein